MVAGKEGPYNGNAIDGKYAKIKIGGFNVDIMYSIVGGLEPPELPLRQELNTQGIEMVYNAKGVGNMVVCKQQHRREAFLLKNILNLGHKGLPTALKKCHCDDYIILLFCWIKYNDMKGSWYYIEPRP